MSVVRLFESEYAAICFIKEKKILELEWKQFAGSDAYREIFEKALELAEEQQAKRWLANNTKMRTIRPVDQEWTTQNLIPKLEELKIDKMAVVESTDAMNRMSMNNILTKAEEIVSFKIKLFPHHLQALRWLSEN